MKQLQLASLAALALLVAACSGGTSSGAAPSEGPESAASANAARIPPPYGAVQLDPASCPTAALHVYNPHRLWLLNGCQLAVVHGVIRKVKAEPDGDLHVRMRVDATDVDSRGGQYINAENTRQQGGDLVLEPVCEKLVSQADAIPACKNPAQTDYHNPLQVPAVGKHVAAEGWWVFDSSHGWNELHPVPKLDVIP